MPGQLKPSSVTSETRAKVGRFLANLEQVDDVVPTLVTFGRTPAGQARPGFRELPTPPIKALTLTAMRRWHSVARISTLPPRHEEAALEGPGPIRRTLRSAPRRCGRDLCRSLPKLRAPQFGNELPDRHRCRRRPLPSGAPNGPPMPTSEADPRALSSAAHGAPAVRRSGPLRCPARYSGRPLWTGALQPLTAAGMAGRRAGTWRKM